MKKLTLTTAFLLLLIGLVLGTMDAGNHQAHADSPRLQKLQHMHQEGRICDDCAKDNFANYEQCWKYKCKICVKCCKTEKDDCCCRHRKENCWKKCKDKLPGDPGKHQKVY